MVALGARRGLATGAYGVGSKVERRARDRRRIFCLPGVDLVCEVGMGSPDRRDRDRMGGAGVVLVFGGCNGSGSMRWE